MSEKDLALSNSTDGVKAAEPNCTFEHVVTLGGGNLAILWLFIRLIVGVSENSVRYSFGIWGLILQLAFMHFFWVLRKERKAYLSHCTTKSRDDVISVMLGWLMMLSICGAILFALMAILVSIVHGNGKSITLP
jgi:hypothetical protein